MGNPEPEQLHGPWTGYEGAAEHVGLPASSLRKMVMKREIPFRKVGKRVLFSVPALDEWVSRNGATTEAA